MNDVLPLHYIQYMEYMQFMEYMQYMQYMQYNSVHAGISVRLVFEEEGTMENLLLFITVCEKICLEGKWF